MRASAGSEAGGSVVRDPSGRRGLWIALAALLLVPLLAYPSMILRGWEPPALDTQASKPFGLWGIETSHRTGETPSWYPYIFGGMPSYGSFIYTPRSPLDPLADVQRVARESRGLYYYVLFVIAGMSAFALFRRQGCSRLSSTVAALLFSMTPYFPGSMDAGHSTKIEALCLTPLFLLAIDYLLDRPDALRCAALAGAAALLAWANHPQVAFYALLIGLLYAAGRLFVDRSAELRDGAWLRLLAAVVAAIVLTAAMAAEPFLAILEYTPYSIRGGSGVSGAAAASGGVGWNYATTWSFHPKELVSFLFPAWYGLEGTTYWGPMPFTQSTHYFGILALGLALYGLFRMGGRRRVIWALISGVILVIGFGRYLPIFYGPMYYLVPMFSKFRVPSMIYSLLPLCLGFLIAGGLDALLASVEHWSAPVGKRKGKAASPSASPARRILIAMAVVVVCWILLFVAARAGVSNPQFMVRPNELARSGAGAAAALQRERLTLLEHGLARGSVLVLGALALLLLAAAAKSSSRRTVAAGLGVALALLTVGDAVQIGHHFYHAEPLPPSAAGTPMPEASRFVASQPGAFRIFPAESSLLQSNGFGLARLESIGGYHPAKLRIYQDLIGAELITHPAILQLLNVRYILSPERINLGVEPLFSGDGFVYPYPDSLPRAWAVPRIDLVADQRAMLARLGADDFRPEETAFLYSSAAHPPRNQFAAASVALREHGNGFLRLEVDAQGEAFVVASEIAYPPGWRATVNGALAPIYRVDHVLQGIVVPAGRSEVTLRMRSPRVAAGRLISRSAGGIAILLAVAGFWLERRRRAAYAGSAK